MQTRGAHRLGILTLPVGTLLYAYAVWRRGHLFFPGDDGFSDWAASDDLAIYGAITLNVTVAAVFGIIALTSWLGPGPTEKFRLYGAAWAVAGLTAGLAISGVIAIAWPAMADDPEAAKATMENGLWIVWAPFSLAAFGLGGGLLGLTIWMRGMRAEGALFAVGVLGLSLPMWWPVEMAGALVFTAASGWLAWHVWHAPAPARMPKP